MNRIEQLYRNGQPPGAEAMIYYVTAGYPDLATTATVIDALVEGGMGLLELGIPFSDPIADGPTIQFTSQMALEGGTTVRNVIEIARGARQRHPDLPMLIFSAYNPIFRFGDKEFVKTLAEAGVDGLLIPDLPHEEAGDLMKCAQAAGLSMVFLVAPTTTPERAARIAEASTGFIYYISLKGVTGAQVDISSDMENKIATLRKITDKPLAIGFGIARPDHARAVARIADGVVVGSALMKLIGKAAQSGDVADQVRAYAREMGEAVRAVQADGKE